MPLLKAARAPRSLVQSKYQLRKLFVGNASAAQPPILVLMMQLISAVLPLVMLRVRPTTSAGFAPGKVVRRQLTKEKPLLLISVAPGEGLGPSAAALAARMSQRTSQLVKNRLPPPQMKSTSPWMRLSLK